MDEPMAGALGGMAGVGLLDSPRLSERRWGRRLYSGKEWAAILVGK